MMTCAHSRPAFASCPYHRGSDVVGQIVGSLVDQDGRVSHIIRQPHDHHSFRRARVLRQNGWIKRSLNGRVGHRQKFTL